MQKPFARSLFIFRRDLRLEDNTALNLALEQSDQVIPCFIFDPRQITPHPYQSLPALHCMSTSLEELNEALHKKGSQLHLVMGKAEEVVEEVINAGRVQAVFFNNDYTPFSRLRDEAIKRICSFLNTTCISAHDSLLTPPDQSIKDDGDPYTIFTPYFKKNSVTKPAKPKRLSEGRFITVNLPLAVSKQFMEELKYKNAHQLFRKGGRKEALNLIETKLPLLTDYAVARDIPTQEKTSGLSVHHKFGTCSIREVYHAALSTLGKDSPFIKELYWRDFFTQICFQFPHVLHGAFHRRYDTIQWSDNEENFQKWCRGETGFPIVDAGMRQLNETGFMHNRVRMIVASFLTKDLHINWRWGERYFAQKLLDYDPAVNNGSWQWAASTGCDAQPYFRIFNPWLQQEKFDSECFYIKKWVPELKHLSSKQIHNLKNETGLGYPIPMVDHGKQKDIAIQMFQAVAAAE